jgi:hypothetical protein
VPRTFLLWLSVAVLLLAGFQSAAMGQNGGEACPPLDDTFIHFQYASRMAEGELYTFQEGAAPSSGSTSLLWSAWLAVGVRLGLGETALFGWALASGAVLAALAVWHTERWLTRVSDRRTGTAGATALLLCGAWLWGAFSGMEIALFSAAIAGVLDLGFRPGPASQRGALAWACVLALVRPEGALLVGVFFFARLVFARVRGASRIGAMRSVAPWLLPLALGTVQPALNLALTGQLASSSALAKYNPRSPGPSETVLTDFIQEVVAGAFMRHYLGPLGLIGLVCFAIGLAALHLRDRGAERTGLGAAAGLAWAVPILFLGLFLPITWTHYRYVMPYLVVYVPVGILGAAMVDRAVARLRGPEVAPTPFVVGALLALWAFTVPTWADRYAKNTVDIASQHVNQARWVAAKLRPDAVVAANDIGALAWFGQRRVVDLEGIASVDLLADTLAGEGAVFSRLLREPPTALLVFPGWFPSSFQSGAFVPVRHARLAERSVSGGDDLVLATLDVELARSGEREPEGTGQVIDSLDVGDRLDEEAHAWSQADAPRPAARANTVLSGRYVGGPRLLDTARRLEGSASFRMKRGNTSAELVARFGPSEGAATLEVRLDGTPAGLWQVPAVEKKDWVDVRLLLPEGASSVSISIHPVDLTTGPQGGWHLARVWTTEAVGDSP